VRPTIDERQATLHGIVARTITLRFSSPVLSINVWPSDGDEVWLRQRRRTDVRARVVRVLYMCRLARRNVMHGQEGGRLEAGVTVAAVPRLAVRSVRRGVG
jgi:hypothetical protein